jgi:hypothetical protein
MLQLIQQKDAKVCQFMVLCCLALTHCCHPSLQDLVIEVGQVFESRINIQAHVYAMAERDDRRYNMPIENYEEISFVCANPACIKEDEDGEEVPCTSIRFTSFWQTVKLSEDGADDDDSEEESVTQQRWHCIAAEQEHASTCIGVMWFADVGRPVVCSYKHNVLMFAVRCHVHSAAAVLQSLSKSLLQLAAAAANQLPAQQQQHQMRLRLPAQCRQVRRGGGGSEATAPHRFGATGFCNL